MKKKKVLQVTGSLKIGGIEKLVASFYENVDRSRIQMDYLVYGDKKGELEEKIRQLGRKRIQCAYPVEWL